MPAIGKRIAALASGASSNPLSGSQYEFAPFDGTLEVGINADKAQVTCAIMSGPDILAEPGFPVPFTSAGEAMPKVPDDYHWVDEVAKGDRLNIVLTNGNAAATNINVVVRLTPA